MKVYLLLFLLIVTESSFSQATKIDCCADVGTKSTIIINSSSANTSSSTTTSSNNNDAFTFQLATSANTSAGVYNPSNILVRTLWSGIYYNAGCYSARWDGKLDGDSVLAPFGNYTVKILTNNVQYTWQGVIGNTSASLTDNFWKSYGGITGGAFLGGKGFVGHGFYEGGSTDRYFGLDAIQTCLDLNAQVYGITLDLCTDGTNVYYAIGDQYQNAHYLYAVKASDLSPVAFTNETAHATGRNGEGYSTHLIGFRQEDNNNQYNGIGVSGSFIFASRRDNNTLNVFDKTTGSQVQTLTFTNPGRMAGRGNMLWFISNNSCKKYTVNSDGTLTDAGISLAVSQPQTVAISPDGLTVSVSDQATQNVQSFSTSDGSFLWALGTPGGYNGSPAVTNYKFNFYGYYSAPFVAYQDDGSIWFNDDGNYRLMHFNADRTFKERIMYIPASRSTNIDLNDPTSVFADELEFQRDYSKPLDNGVNGSWSLKNNWRPNTQSDIYRKFTNVVTLSNRHKYASADNNLYDLTANGSVLVGTYNGAHIEADGSIYHKNIVNNNSQAQITKQTLTGFSGNNMPQWSAEQVLATTPTFLPEDAISYEETTVGSATNSNEYVFFKRGTYPGYHLAALSYATNKWLWKSSKSTFSKYFLGNTHYSDGSQMDYSGDYPRNGDFDIGNNNGFTPQHSITAAIVNGQDIFWNVNGEAWKDGGEVNIINHFNSDGLLIGNFGKTYVDGGATGSNAGFAGNAFSTALTKVGGNYYYDQCDENAHAGITCWKITGLNTIQEQPVALALASAPVTVPDASDLMAGVPYRSSGFYGGHGWTVYPSSGDSEKLQYPGWVVNTTVRSWERNDVDIAFYVDFAQGSVDNSHYISRTLGTNNTNNWKLSGGVSDPNASGRAYFEMLDASGKILLRFYIGYTLNVNGTDVPLYTGPIDTKSIFKAFNKFTLTDTNGSVVFQIGKFAPIQITSYESGGDFNKPATFRIRPFGSGGSKGIGSIKGLRFVSQ